MSGSPGPASGAVRHSPPDEHRGIPDFQEMLEAIPDAVVAVSADGVITVANTQAAELFGYPLQDLLGQSVDILVPEASRDAHPGNRDAYFTNPVRRSMGEGRELAGRRRDGTQFAVEISLSSVHSEGGRLVFAAIRDITDRKRFEQTLQEKNVELERASSAKDRFLASMSHELRTPLNAILGFTGTLLMGLPGPLNPEQQGQLETVRYSARHLLAIINDLLDLAKIESGKVELTLEDVDCQAVVHEVATSLQPLAENKGLSFAVNVPEATVTARADRRALSQILINLTNNAIKFTESGSIRLVLVGGGRSEDGDAVTIDVVDTGIGISPADQVRLFEPFEQVGSAVQEGTGLGLHISRKLAELLGGTIRCHSAVGAGSMFTVALRRH